MSDSNTPKLLFEQKQLEEWKYYMRLGFEWARLHDDVRILADKIRKEHSDYLTHFKGLVVIARGGYGSGIILAHELGISNVRSVTMSSYNDNDERGEMKISEIFEDDGRWLIHDELADSGCTLVDLRKYIPNSVMTMVYIKPQARMALTYNTIPYIYAREIPRNEWIILPWEITTRNQDELFQLNKSHD